MKIATWNINGLKARFDFLKLWLEARQPDVVGLQELKTTDETFPFAEFEALGYRAIAHGQRSWNGVAVLSRRPMEVRQIGLPGQDGAGARLLSVAVEDDLSSSRCFEFTTVYCPNGKTLSHDDYAAKLDWFDSLAAFWSEQTAEMSVICGDFNIVPQALDSWMGESGEGKLFHTEAERARLQRLLDLGFVDLFRSLHPQEQAFSWWDYRGGAFHRKQGLRIDLLLGSPAVRDRLQSAVTDREFRKKQDGLTASDHAPVIAELAG